MKTARLIGAVILSLICSYIIWLGFHFTIPYMFIIDSGWRVVIALMCLSFLCMGSVALAYYISWPIFYIAADISYIKKISSIFFFIHGYSSVVDCWGVDIDYNGWDVISALVCMVVVLTTYISIIYNPLAELN